MRVTEDPTDIKPVLALPADWQKLLDGGSHQPYTAPTDGTHQPYVGPATPQPTAGGGGAPGPGNNPPGGAGGTGTTTGTGGPGATPTSPTDPTPPTAPTGPPIDWASIYWGSLGLTPDLIAQINKIFGLYPDQSIAFQVAQNYLRGTDWYAKTFPGIAYGIRNGLFTDETGYRSYVNDLNNLYQQYNGRAVTGDEVANWLTQGRNVTYIGKAFQGNAIANTEAPDRQYEAGAFTPEGQLSQAQLQAYGQEQAGIDTPLGQQITQRLQQAQQRMSKLFQGSLATPNFTLGPQGLYAPSIQGSRESLGKGGGPDIGA